MENKKMNVLVFPCGSEVGLEIFRSLNNSIHFEVYGASSVDDHGKFVFKNYIEKLPMYYEENFISHLKEIIIKNDIKVIFPAMDNIVFFLKKHELELNCKIVSSDLETTEICLSKTKTYDLFKNIIPIPKIIDCVDVKTQYPIFVKPEIGYGSRGAHKINSFQDYSYYNSKVVNPIFMEYLPGDEVTVDCFTDFNHNLLFMGARKRNRISNGISVNTRTIELNSEIEKIGEKINKKLILNGAWFFQLKKDIDGNYVLLEIASRLAGSSSLYRMKGVNFALLSIYNILKVPIEIIENNYQIELDRSLNFRCKLDFDFKSVYIDLDDTIIINDKVNILAISVLYRFINDNKKIYLITKHKNKLNETLKKYKLINLFDEIFHLSEIDCKANFIKDQNSIFIDDSFAERKAVKNKCNIPVFSIDMIEGL